MRLELGREAQNDLDALREYSLEHHGQARTLRYIDAIERAFRRILQYPASGMPRSNLSAGLRSLPVGEHRLYYRVDAERVLIVRVLHKAMDPLRHL